MGERLLAGLRVVDLAGEPDQLAGRLLDDLGADVVKVEPGGGDSLRSAPPFDGNGRSLRFAAWNVGKASVVVDGPGDRRLSDLLGAADVVLTTPNWPGCIDADPSQAPSSVWVAVTPFGLDGPRHHW